MKNETKILVGSLTAGLFFISCGTWVGSPKKRPPSGTNQVNPDGGTEIDIANRYSVHGALAGLTLTEDKTITDIVAVSADGRNARWTELSAESKLFDLQIDRRQAWNIMLVDSTKIGTEMIVGSFESESLNTFAPIGTGTAGVDLKEISIDAPLKTATSSLDRMELLAALGMSPAVADFFGSIDGASKRYANPDIDGDGFIDAKQPENYRFELAFHVSFDLQVGDTKHAIVNDMVGKFLPETTVVSYANTWAYFGLYKKYFAEPPTSYRFMFSEDTVVSNYKGGIELITEPIAAGTALELPYSNTVSGDIATFSVGFMPPVKPPNGTYKIDAGGHSFTFPQVEVPNYPAEQIYLMPFIRFNLNEDKSIKSIDWEWRRLAIDKNSGQKWIPATAEEIEVSINSDGAMFSLQLSDDNGNRLEKTIEFRLTRDPTGNMKWDDATTNYIGITADEAKKVDIDHFYGPALAYADKLGMFIFANIGGNIPPPPAQAN